MHEVGEFDYSRNFYAKDADSLNIMLPVTPNGSPDYETMEVFMHAVQKLVVRDVSEYTARHIEATSEIVK